MNSFLYALIQEAVITTDNFLYFWQKLKLLLAGKVDKVDGKGLSANDYTEKDKIKLAGIAENANDYRHPDTAGYKHIPAGGTAGQVLKNTGDGTAAWAAEKDTTYVPMTGATTAADGTSGLTPAPAKGAANRFLRSDGTWSVPPDTNTTYSVATQSANGLMAAADKKKLDGVAEGANKYTHPAYTAKAAGLYKIASDATGHVSAATAVSKADITALGIPAQDTTYADATTSAHGLMTAADKIKLNAVPEPSTIATRTFVAQQVAEAGHIKKTIVSTLPQPAAADGNTIYMVAKAAGDAGNSYDEYMVIDGAWEKIGDTQTTLTFATNADIDAILAS